MVFSTPKKIFEGPSTDVLIDGNFCHVLHESEMTTIASSSGKTVHTTNKMPKTLGLLKKGSRATYLISTEDDASVCIYDNTKKVILKTALDVPKIKKIRTCVRGCILIILDDFCYCFDMANNISSTIELPKESQLLDATTDGQTLAFLIASRTEKDKYYATTRSLYEDKSSKTKKFDIDSNPSRLWLNQKTLYVQTEYGLVIPISPSFTRTWIAWSSLQNVKPIDILLSQRKRLAIILTKDTFYMFSLATGLLLDRALLPFECTNETSKIYVSDSDEHFAISTEHGIYYIRDDVIRFVTNKKAFLGLRDLPKLDSLRRFQVKQYVLIAKETDSRVTETNKADEVELLNKLHLQDLLLKDEWALFIGNNRAIVELELLGKYASPSPCLLISINCGYYVVGILRVIKNDQDMFCLHLKGASPELVLADPDFFGYVIRQLTIQRTVTNDKILRKGLKIIGLTFEQAEAITSVSPDAKREQIDSELFSVTVFKEIQDQPIVLKNVNNKRPREIESRVTSGELEQAIVKYFQEQNFHLKPETNMDGILAVFLTAEKFVFTICNCFKVAILEYEKTILNDLLTRNAIGPFAKRYVYIMGYEGSAIDSCFDLCDDVDGCKEVAKTVLNEMKIIHEATLLNIANVPINNLQYTIVPTAPGEYLQSFRNGMLVDSITLALVQVYYSVKIMLYDFSKDGDKWNVEVREWAGVYDLVHKFNFERRSNGFLVATSSPGYTSVDVIYMYRFLGGTPAYGLLYYPSGVNREHVFCMDLRDGPPMTSFRDSHNADNF